MKRLPLRVRLALAFAVAMAVVLAVVGGLLYVRLGDSLQEQLDDGLEVRSQALSALAHASGDELASSQLTTEEGFAQVLGPGDRVVSFPERTAPLISERERARASGGAFFLSRAWFPGVGGDVRLHVTSLATDGESLVLVVGASLDDREEALAGLLSQLLVVGPIALVFSSLAGYFLAGAALRPVEAMRRRAAEVSSERPGTRLPLPEARDEIRRLGETLNDMLDRLEAGLARERRFVADASHELRTPLAALRTELELALRRPRAHEELEDALRSASDEVERLGRLADDLLVLARAEDGRLPLRPAELDAGELLDSVARRFEPRARACERPLVVSVSPGEMVTGDPLRLEQALGNLVDNALRHGAGAVRLVAGRDGTSLVLSVSDEGSGLPPAFLGQALEPFSVADSARSDGGAGLGLAIVDAIARAHGGHVIVRNRPGGGTEVILRLPSAVSS